MKAAGWLLLALAGCAAPVAPPAATVVADLPGALADPADPAPAAVPMEEHPLPAGVAPGAVAPAAAARATRGGARIAVAPFVVDPWNHMPGPGLPGEPAPVPNRGLDPAFSQPAADPSFGPTIIGPRSAPDPSAAIGPGHLRTRDDRLFQQPAAGASLRVPLTP